VIDHLDDLAIRRLTPHLDIDGLDRSDADDVLASADLMALDLNRRVALSLRDLVDAAIVRPLPSGGAR
jgi:hypothetical protein